MRITSSAPSGKTVKKRFFPYITCCEESKRTQRVRLDQGPVLYYLVYYSTQQPKTFFSFSFFLLFSVGSQTGQNTHTLLRTRKHAKIPLREPKCNRANQTRARKKESNAVGMCLYVCVHCVRGQKDHEATESKSKTVSELL